MYRAFRVQRTISGMAGSNIPQERRIVATGGKPFLMIIILSQNQMVGPHPYQLRLGGKLLR